MARFSTSNKYLGLGHLLRSEYFLPPLLLAAVFIYFYRLDIIPNPIISGDLVVPYPLPPLQQLALSTPWYNLLSTFLLLNFYSLYGYIVNFLEIILYIPAYFTMLFLLKDLKIKKSIAVSLSIFYLLNPVVFPSTFSYNNLMWPEFFIFGPLFLLYLFRYLKNNERKNLVMLSILISFYLEIQTAPTLYNVRLVIPILLIPALYVFYYNAAKTSLKRTVIDYGLLAVLMLGLNLIPIIQALQYTLFVGGQASLTSSGFQSLHYNNVVYTYQDQNLIFAISGLVVYPIFQNAFLQGYGQLFFFQTLAFDCLVAIAVAWTLIKKLEKPPFVRSLSLSILMIWFFITLTQSGFLDQFFPKLSFLYLWEYPDYLEMALFVLYIPVLAIFVSRLVPWGFPITHQDEITKKQRRLLLTFHFKKVERAFGRIIPVLVVVTLFSYFVPVIYTNSVGFPGVPQYEVQPNYIHDIYDFFLNENGTYRVMMVPFNQILYKELASAIPSDNIFGLPYAYENNPSAFANVSLFKSIYYDLNYDTMGNFTNLLNYTGVKYIIVFNNLTNNTTVNNLKGLSYLTTVSQTSDYSIMLYSYFSSVKVFTDPHIISSKINPATSDYTMELAENFDFNNLSGYNQSHPFVPFWNEYSTYLSYNSAFNFSKGVASIQVSGDSLLKQRQYSLLYQKVTLPPGSKFVISANITSGNNSDAVIFILPLNDSSSSNQNNITNAIVDSSQMFPLGNFGNYSYNV